MMAWLRSTVGWALVVVGVIYVVALILWGN